MVDFTLQDLMVFTQKEERNGEGCASGNGIDQH
jgi:hypothetical protein